MSDDTIWTRARASFLRLNRAAYGHGAHYSIPVQPTDDDVAVDEAITYGQRLEAAARQIITDCRVPRGDYLGVGCRWCENAIDQDGHRPNCPVGALAALLDRGDG